MTINRLGINLGGINTGAGGDITGSITLTLEQVVFEYDEIALTLEQRIVHALDELVLTIEQEIAETGQAALTIEQIIAHAIDDASLSIQQAIFEYGTSTLPIQQIVYEYGTKSLTLEQRIVHAIAAVTPLTIEQQIEAGEGMLVLVIEQIQWQSGTSSLPIQQVVQDVAGVASLTIQQVVTDTGTVSLTIEQKIFDVDDYMSPENGSVRWRPIVFLNGIDVTASLTGSIRVNAEEGAARVAEFQLVPFAGAISLTQWVGKPVTIDYALMDGEVLSEQWRLFTGVVDIPVYDPIDRITSFSCTDNLQGIFEQSERTYIDQLIGGHWSRHIFSDEADNWQYAEDRLSTIPASFDLDAYKVPHLAQWQGKVTPDFVFTAGSIEDQSVSVELASRRDLINKINIEFDYRYGRAKQRERRLSWFHPKNFCEGLHYTKPTKDMIEDAVHGTGWHFAGGQYELLPPSGPIHCGATMGGIIYWSITEDLRQQLVTRATIRVAKRFDQAITEKFLLTVSATQSQSVFGVLEAEEAGSMEADSDELQGLGVSQEVTQDGYISTSPGTAGGRPSFGGLAGSNTRNGDADPDFSELPGTGIDANGDRFYDDNTSPGTAYEDAQEAMETLLHKARVRILEAHRRNTLGCVVPIAPYLERHHTVRIDTPTLSGTGKVRALSHLMDIDSGRVVTAVSLGVSRTDTATTVTEDELLAPARPDTGTTPPLEMERPHFGGLDNHFGGLPTSPPYDVTWTGYIGNAGVASIIVQGGQRFDVVPGQNIYPHRFIIRSEEIEAEAREPMEPETDAEYVIAIPNEPLAMAA